MTERPCRLIIMGVLFFTLAVIAPSQSPAAQPTMSPDKLEKGMTGHGLTVFEGTEAETFPVEVMGVLSNVMPDQDIILIKANTPLLNHTMIMSGMSGSPIYINGKLIGALAYSWSFEKEPIAGVTPIQNMRNAHQRDPLELDHDNLNKIATPMVATGFRPAIKDQIGRALDKEGLNAKFISGGQSSGAGSAEGKIEATLDRGSAVGVQLMRGDLSMTAIGTVTEVNDTGVFAFGHPFLGAGQVELPMTTARVHTYMPSYQSSFKLASPIEPVGTVTEDRQAAIVGRTGVTPSMLPVTINLSSPNQQFDDSYQIELVRDRFLTPGLLNSAIANFATSKLEQRGVNWIELDGTVRLDDGDQFTFSRTRLVSGSYSAWTFLPLAQLWSNRFQSFEPEEITLDITLHHGRESATIKDLWVNKSLDSNPAKLTVYTRIDPFRGSTTIRKSTIRLPSDINGQGIRLSAVPASQLKQLEASPTTFRQLISSMSVERSPKQLAIVMEIPSFSMNAAGHRMQNIPHSVAGTYQAASQGPVNRAATTRHKTLSTDWILGGSKTIEIPLSQP